MAKIIYGVCGQGLGHAARSQAVLMHLKKKKHELMILTYDQAVGLLSPDFPVVTIPGLGLTYENNELNYWKTVYSNAMTLARQGKNWPRLLRQVRKFKPDIVITDFEPLSASFAHLDKIPLVSIDNQHQLTNTKMVIPRKHSRAFLTDKVVVKSMVWGADYYLITTFYKTRIAKPHTFLFPPIVRRDIMTMRPAVKDFILVYQNSNFDYILDELRKLKKYNFIVYSGRKERKTKDNITLKNYHNADWLTDLKNCRAIIGTAGISLISEALWLEKPYFAIPVAHQVEQAINALFIKKLGYGDFSDKFSATHGQKFLSKLETYRKSLKKRPKRDMSELSNKLDSIIASLVR